MSTDAPDTGNETTEPIEATAPADASATEAPAPDLQAEIDKWKAQARKHEQRAKANASAAQQLEELRQQSMTEQERAVEQAKAAARSEVLAEVGASRVEDALRAALAGRPVNVDALIDGLDRSRFLSEEGQPDRDGIAAWVDAIAPASQTPTPVDLGQGARPNTTPKQLTRDDLRTMSPDQIVDARKAGLLDDALQQKA
jgi:hypothetical protein